MTYHILHITTPNIILYTDKGFFCCKFTVCCILNSIACNTGNFLPAYFEAFCSTLYTYTRRNCYKVDRFLCRSLALYNISICFLVSNHFILIILSILNCFFINIRYGCILCDFLGGYNELRSLYHVQST